MRVRIRNCRPYVNPQLYLNFITIPNKLYRDEMGSWIDFTQRHAGCKRRQFWLCAFTPFALITIIFQILTSSRHNMSARHCKSTLPLSSFCKASSVLFILTKVPCVSYVLGIWGFKTSLLVSYVRLVPGAYRVVPISLAVIVTMAHIAFLLVFLLLCIPVWDISQSIRS